MSVAEDLPAPAGEPVWRTQEIIEAVDAYLSCERDPLVITRGLRHIYHRAEMAWDESVAKAKDGATYEKIVEATGDAWSRCRGI